MVELHYYIFLLVYWYSVEQMNIVLQLFNSVQQKNISVLKPSSATLMDNLNDLRINTAKKKKV